MYLTLNISSKEIRLLTTNKQGVQHWSHKELPSGWIKDGHILEPKGVGAVIVSLLESVKTSKDNVVICIAGLPFIYRMAKFPLMKQKLLKESVRHFMRKEVSMPIEQMCLSWAVIDESNGEFSLLILGVDQNVVDSIAETMRVAKIKYWTLELKSLALARAASLDNAIVISAESDCYDIVITENGNISTMHTVSMEEESRSEIEHSKQILIETSKAITYDAKKRGHVPEKNIPLLVTGELSCDKDFRDLIQTELGYKVELLTPPLALPVDFPVHLYSTNIGLALRGSGDNFELVPQNASARNYINLDIMLGRYASHPKRISSAYLISSVVLSFAICLALPIYEVHIERDVESLRLQNQLATVNQQIRQAKLTDEKAREIESRTNKLYTQLENLRKGHRELFGDQGESAGNLREVVNALPFQSYFTHISHLPQQITITGHADNAFQALEYASILEQEGLFSDIRIQQIGNAPGDNITANRVTFDVIIARPK